MTTTSVDNTAKRLLLRPSGWLGIAIVVLAEAQLLAGVEPVAIWFTPIIWTGYILVADAVIFRLRGDSLVTTRRRELLVMLPWSVACWLVFEAYNLKLGNWYYTGLPSNPIAAGLGYTWSFATIFPGVLETYELILALGLAGVICGLLWEFWNFWAAARWHYTLPWPLDFGRTISRCRSSAFSALFRSPTNATRCRTSSSSGCAGAIDHAVVNV